MTESGAPASPAPPAPGPRRATRRIVAGAAAVVVLAVGVFVTGAAGGGGPAAGREAPGFDLPTVTDRNRQVALGQFRGTPVVLNFWASWCVPCRKELPAFQSVAHRLEGRVAFVGVNHQDGRGGATDLLAETGVRYPSVYDPGGSVARSYGLFGMPTTVFISADGRIVEKRTGELSRSELVETIQEVFGITAGT